MKEHFFRYHHAHITSISLSFTFVSIYLYFVYQQGIYFGLKNNVEMVSEIKKLAVLEAMWSLPQLGFILQTGYFKCGKKFYTPELFRKEDIKYVMALLRLKKVPDLSKYRTSTYIDCPILSKNIRESIMRERTP